MAYMSNLIKDSQGEQTNPTTATVMADTGAITLPGFYEVIVTASASADAQFQLQHRDAANTAAASDVVGFYIPANTPGQFKDLVFINSSERVRVMMDANLTGTAWVNVTAVRVQ